MAGNEADWFWRKTPGRASISRSIDQLGRGNPVRIMSTVIDGEEGAAAITEGGQVVLRTTPKGRYEIKATFYEKDRSVSVLTIQRFSNSGSHEYFSLVGAEIKTLLDFARTIQTAEIKHPGHVSLPALDPGADKLEAGRAQQLFAENQELFLQIASQENLAHDVVALGYRRQQLHVFERLLIESEFFAACCVEENKTPEALWQYFFEHNTWIFGYGLSYIFLSGLEDRKLEQVTRGHNLEGAGKRADGVMKTQAEINSLCFVEIKRHDTALLEGKPYRSDTWAPSSELAGGVAQSQVTVHAAIEEFGRQISPASKDGDPTGETLFNIAPRAFLVVGSLDQFQTERGINVSKFKSFELYRRNVRSPEILTFDELYYRARFIVETTS
ncbi:Shedu immune nuclease family protein [Methylobacterium sp. J-068]|uniref:Shedu immune nuclease family protein n=1 Tax=Methylobacterium sp. J-068 TaxID=2836649 RepID=UPI001FBA05EB|nr:Shedu immune nuclease family protein [Methylobacterium sp. J-068]MCJ2032709.1 DUF4263 domain-containing protein [Methylobacterium sp. J-068]